MSPLGITLLMLAGFAGFAWLSWRKLAIVVRLQPEVRWDHPAARLKAVLVNGFLQQRMIARDWKPGLMHAVIFLGFMALLLRKLQLIAIGYHEPFVYPGLAGGLFARLIVVSTRGLPDRFSQWRRSHPFRFAAACALGVALIGLATGGATAGAGYVPTRALLEGQADLPGVYTILKFCATWLSAWTGVPAGVFAPSLAIGAGIGNDVALLTGGGQEAAIPLIALGMAGFLAATTGGPITAFIIVMEMVSGQAMVLSLMACSLLSSGVARLVTKPMYQELADLLPVPPAPRPPQPVTAP